MNKKDKSNIVTEAIEGDSREVMLYELMQANHYGHEAVAKREFILQELNDKINMVNAGIEERYPHLGNVNDSVFRTLKHNLNMDEDKPQIILSCPHGYYVPIEGSQREFLHGTNSLGVHFWPVKNCMDIILRKWNRANSRQMSFDDIEKNYYKKAG